MNCEKPDGGVSEEGMNETLICSWKTDISGTKVKTVWNRRNPNENM